MICWPNFMEMYSNSDLGSYLTFTSLLTPRTEETIDLSGSRYAVLVDGVNKVENKAPI